MTKSIGQEFGHAAKELSDTRDSLLNDADQMVSKLPMKYLWSKKNLRPYALARIYGAISKMTLYKIHVALRRALSIWREPPEVKMTEIQVGFMVIAKRFENMWRSALRRKFDKWAFWYSLRFQEKREFIPILLQGKFKHGGGIFVSRLRIPSNGCSVLCKCVCNGGGRSSI